MEKITHTGTVLIPCVLMQTSKILKVQDLYVNHVMQHSAVTSTSHAKCQLSKKRKVIHCDLSPHVFKYLE